MSKFIKVETSFKVGSMNSIVGTFEMSSSTFDNDISKLKKFLTYAFNDEHSNVICDIQVWDDSYKVNDKESVRIIHDWYNNSFDERTYNELEKSYSNSLVRDYGTEGNAKKEMKKRILKLTKEINNKIQN
ncbi:hypothetical protein [Paenibacillus sp. Mc5Re-14]|uniref:hypothetical protein n=1 Tax=Paenibacillus sp. Mc5Re-14 TaxID=1030529 RepID=UPI000A932BA3|nr:hypothetical protein [Paenibacillus sp. Mc5Re-14]